MCTYSPTKKKGCRSVVRVCTLHVSWNLHCRCRKRGTWGPSRGGKKGGRKAKRALQNLRSARSRSPGWRGGGDGAMRLPRARVLPTGPTCWHGWTCWQNAGRPCPGLRDTRVFGMRVFLGRQIFACCWRDPNRNARVRSRCSELGDWAGTCRCAISLAKGVSTCHQSSKQRSPRLQRLTLPVVECLRVSTR